MYRIKILELGIVATDHVTFPWRCERAAAINWKDPQGGCDPVKVNDSPRGPSESAFP